MSRLVLTALLLGVLLGACSSTDRRTYRGGGLMLHVIFHVGREDVERD